MDHILPPRGTLAKSITIPYYVTPEHKYEGQGFFEFPKLKGFDREYLLSSHASPKTCSEFLSFLQSWGFFALLQEGFSILSITVEEDNFIQRSEDGSSRISTTKLPSLVNAWTRQEKSDPEKDELLLFAKYLVMLDNYLKLILDDGSDIVIHQSLSQEDFQAIDALILGIVCVAEVFGSIVFHYTGQRYIQARLGQTLRRRYREAGWCIHLIDAVKRDIAYTTAHWYNSFIDRRSSDQDHSPCWDSDSCTVFAGIVKNYHNLHTEDCDRATCSYSSLAVDQREILKIIIRDRNIPVLTFWPNAAGEVELRVQLYQRASRMESFQNENCVKCYAAYSHVWLDGFGDPEGKGMLSCQLRRLQRLANEVIVTAEAPVPFWIDILCIPREREVKRLAIDSMRHIYREAQVTIVLDRHLQNLRDEYTPEQVAQTIITSNWRMRLWTLQEGLLGQQLVFHLGDGFVSSDTLFASFLQSMQEKDPLFSFRAPGSKMIVSRKMSVDLLFLVGYGVMSTGGDISLDPNEPAKVLNQLLPRLAARSTSRQEDEAICLSILLGQDSSKYFEVSNLHEDRMRALFKSLEQVPLGFIFRSGPRLPGDSCGWMPFSFLRKPWQPEMPYLDAVGCPSERGLLFSLPGYKIRVTEEDAKQAVGKGLSVCIGSTGEEQYWATFVEQRDRSAARWPEFSEQDLILIPCEALGNGFDDIRCIIMGDVNKEEDISYTRFMALLDLIPREKLSAEKEALSGHALLEELEPATQWCIS